LLSIVKSNNNGGKLVYVKESHSLMSVPKINSDITLLLAYINIGFDSETMTATQVWGFHHDFNWIKRELSPPSYVKGKLSLDIELEGRDSKRISSANNWKTYQDEKSGCICFGNPETTGDYIEFFSKAN